MGSWVLVPCLVALRGEFNALSPGRDKGADGSIGDSAHTSSSDHTPDEQSDVLRDHDADAKNEVHALDIDSSGPWPAGRSFSTLVSGIVARERARWLDPTDRCRLKYVIFNRRIYSQSNDFRGEPYTQEDPHTNHAHFSARYETVCENDTRPWGVTPLVAQEDDVTEADINKIINGVVAKLKDAPTGSDVYPGRDVEALAGDLHAFLDDFAGDAKGAAVRPARPGSLGALLRELVTADVPGRLAAIEAALTPETPPAT